MAVLYFWHFHSTFSREPSDWGAFGSYFTVVFSVVYITIFIILTVQTIKLQESIAKNQESARREQLTHEVTMLLINFKWNRLELFAGIVDGISEFSKYDPNETGELRKLTHMVSSTRRAVSIFGSVTNVLFSGVCFTDAKNKLKICENLILTWKSGQSIDDLNTAMNNANESLVDLYSTLLKHVINQINNPQIFGETN